MQYISPVLRSAIIVTLFPSIILGVTSSTEPDLVEQTIEAIRDCIDSEPIQWPEEWKQEYMETIRRAVELHRDVPHYTTRPEILVRGFEAYWQSFKKNNERSFFEVHCARMRWYTEHLMESEFPTEKERQKLSDQFTDIWNYAANSLLKQFPFLYPNAVQKAKEDDLSICYSKIDAPLMPVYLSPMSGEQVEQIKKRWDELRYARVDILRRLDNNSKMPCEKSSMTSSNSERDYKLTKESLSQLLGVVWKIVPKRPDYYLQAINNRIESLKFSIQLSRQARLDQQHLEKERSRQLLQTEHISFLLATLLETMQYQNRSAFVKIQKQKQLEQQNKAKEGGGIYELKKNQKEKK